MGDGRFGSRFSNQGARNFRPKLDDFFGTVLQLRFNKLSQEQFGKQLATASHSKMDVENQLSFAYLQVEGMLAGSVELEDFVKKGLGPLLQFPLKRDTRSACVEIC